MARGGSGRGRCRRLCGCGSSESSPPRSPPRRPVRRRTNQRPRRRPRRADRAGASEAGSTPLVPWPPRASGRRAGPFARRAPSPGGGARPAPRVAPCSVGARLSMARAARTAHGFVLVTNDDGSGWARARVRSGDPAGFALWIDRVEPVSTPGVRLAGTICGPCVSGSQRAAQFDCGGSAPRATLGLSGPHTTLFSLPRSSRDGAKAPFSPSRTTRPRGRTDGVWP